jgi:pimeloyl-ACP methyl ester carboxylesterase
MAEIIFVHGALVRDGEWWWQQVAQQVHDFIGVRSRVIELPSCGEGTGSAPGTAGLIEDAQALTTALDQTDSAIVVGHSYGGTVIAEGADHPSVRHLLYISSYLPDIGQSQAEIMSGEHNPVEIAPNDDGTVSILGYTAASCGDRFWQDLTDESIRSGAWERVTSQSISAFGTPTTHAAWRDRLSTYLVCMNDRSTSVDLQRFHAARANRSFDLPTGHHPFLSRPDLVTEHVIEILRTI